MLYAWERFKEQKRQAIIIIGAVRVHTIRAARVQTAFAVHSWGTQPFLVYSFYVTLLHLSHTFVQVWHACMSEVCAI